MNVGSCLAPRAEVSSDFREGEIDSLARSLTLALSMNVCMGREGSDGGYLWKLHNIVLHDPILYKCMHSQ